MARVEIIKIPLQAAIGFSRFYWQKRERVKNIQFILLLYIILYYMFPSRVTSRPRRVVRENERERDGGREGDMILQQ